MRVSTLLKETPASAVRVSSLLRQADGEGDLAQVIKVMGRAKHTYAEFLHQKTGHEWEASSYGGRGSPYEAKYRWFLMPRTPQNAFDLEMNVSAYGDKLSCRVTLSKGQRSIGYAYFDAVSPADFQTPGKLVTNKVLAGLAGALAGSYSKEVEELQKAVKESVAKAEEALQSVKALEKLCQGSPEQVEANIDKINTALRNVPYFADRMTSGIEHYVKVIKEKG